MSANDALTQKLIRWLRLDRTFGHYVSLSAGNRYS